MRCGLFTLSPLYIVCIGIISWTSVLCLSSTLNEHKCGIKLVSENGGWNFLPKTSPLILVIVKEIIHRSVEVNNAWERDMHGSYTDQISEKNGPVDEDEILLHQITGTDDQLYQRLFAIVDK